MDVRIDNDIDQDDADSEELRLHIHHLLRDYSRTHYTTNYIEFTENLTAEFVEGLKPVPLTDPYSPVIPPDPYDVFSQIHGLPSLPPYDQTFQTTEEARLYLKKVMGSTLGIPKTERVIWDENYGRDLPLHKPIFIALSRKSRQSTPKLGTKKPTHSPNLYRDLLKSQEIKPIQAEEIEDPPLFIDEILQLKLQIDDKDIQAVRSLLKSTSIMLRSQKGYKNKYFDPAFLRDDSSAHEYKHPEMFVPIFPRSQMPKSGLAPPTAPSSAGLKGLVDLPSKILPKVAVEHSDDDISMQNLMVVDGWETIRSSPPSTPSSGNSDNSNDQIDELLLRSTPNTEPALIDELFNVQMEVPQFPRSRKIGGNGGIKPHILAGKTLQTFLQPLLVKTSMQTVQGPVVEQRSSPEPSSLFGQPPSALEYPNEVSSHDVHDDLDVEIENLYKGQNLPNFIMDEVVDEKQIFLMEVPDLPEPNVYARKEITFPTKFPEFLVPQDVNGGKGLPHQFLKKMKGKPSLNLALSWVAFTANKKLPTITEIAGVTDIFDGTSLRNDPSGVPSEADLAKADMILRSASSTDSPNPVEHLRFLSKESSSYRPPHPDDGFKMLLNRSERRRVAKLEGRINDMKASDSAGSVVDGDCDVHSVEQVRKEGSHELDDATSRLTKRPRIDNATDDNTDEDSGMLSCVQETPLLLAPTTVMDMDTDAHYDAAGPDSDSNAFRHCEDEENKENWSLLSSSFSQSVNAASDYHRYYQSHLNTEYLQALENDDPELADKGTFPPLSFDSRLPLSTLFSQALNCPAQSNEKQQEFSMDNSFDVSNSLVSKALESRSLLELPTEPEIALHHLGTQAFAQLRAKTISSRKETQLSVPAPNILPADQDHKPRETPADIYDSNTLRLPESISMPQSIHKYMASLDILQKQALVRSLESQECLVDLVERQSLDGVDLILDPHSAIIFLSLFTLASQCDKCVERVAAQSWKYHQILVIFEAYPQSCAMRGDKTLDSGLDAYTPPILKAIKKFRRNLNIVAAFGTKCQETEVSYVFANSVDEGALFARLYGTSAEEKDETGGAIWGDRGWLDGDFLEDEEANLASADGMNRFSASIILCQVSLQEFLNINPEERISRFGGYIGNDTVKKFNIYLEGRYKAMEMTSE